MTFAEAAWIESAARDGQKFAVARIAEFDPLIFWKVNCMWSWSRRTRSARESSDSQAARARRRARPRQSLEHLEPRQVLATFSLGSSKVAAANDYFAIEQNNVLDYTEAQSIISGVDDRQHAGLDDSNLVSPTVSNGAYNFTTTTSSQIYFLHPGVVDGERVPPDRNFGVVPEEKTGESIPIDTSKYFMLNIKITAPDNIPDPAQVAGAAYQGNIQWDNGRAVPTNTATRSFFLFPGTNIYSFNLKNMALSAGSQASGPWTGMMSGLRLYPSNTANVPLSIDWVTLTGANQSSVPVTIGGATGNVAVGLSTDGDVSHLIKVNAPTVQTDDAYLQRREFVPSSLFSAVSSVDTSMLAPGTYYLHLLNPLTRTALSGTVAQQFKVNAAPTLKVLTPSAYGDLTSDYATTIRGDAWDFSQATDFKIPFVTDPAEYGVGQIVTDPVTSTYGQLSTGGNGWLKYDNFTASNPANRNDPSFLLPLGAAINPSRYRNLTIRMALDRQRDLGEGSVARTMWSEMDPLTGGFTNTIVQTDDIIIQNGVQDLRMNLANVKLEPLSKSSKPWTSSKAIQYLRIDPHEFPSQTLAYFDQVYLTRNERTIDGKFTITWSAADANNDSLTVSKIILDPDKTTNGNEITVATNVANTGSYLIDTRNLSTLGAGRYYVRLELTDGQNTVVRNSSNVLDVNPVGPAGTVQMYRAYNPNANFHFFTTSEPQFDNAVKVGYQDEATASPAFSIYSTQTGSSTPLFRLYNLQKGFHYYTISAQERDQLVALTPQQGQPGFGTVGWRYEGIEGYMFGDKPAGTTEIFRLYNKDSGVHLFTQDAGIKNAILAQFPDSWQQHSSVGYAFAPGQSAGSGSAGATGEMEALLAELSAGTWGGSGDSQSSAAAPVVAPLSLPEVVTVSANSTTPDLSVGLIALPVSPTTSTGSTQSDEGTEEVSSDLAGGSVITDDATTDTDLLFQSISNSDLNDPWNSVG